MAFTRIRTRIQHADAPTLLVLFCCAGFDPDLPPLSNHPFRQWRQWGVSFLHTQTHTPLVTHTLKCLLIPYTRTTPTSLTKSLCLVGFVSISSTCMRRLQPTVIILMHILSSAHRNEPRSHMSARSVSILKIFIVLSIINSSGIYLISLILIYCRYPDQCQEYW